jgi:enoyl-CoA hydratase
MGYETILVERPNPRIVRIVMSRHEARNVQNLQATVVSKKGVNQSSKQ